MGLANVQFFQIEWPWWRSTLSGTNNGGGHLLKELCVAASMLCDLSRAKRKNILFLEQAWEGLERLNKHVSPPIRWFCSVKFVFYTSCTVDCVSYVTNGILLVSWNSCVESVRSVVASARNTWYFAHMPLPLPKMACLFCNHSRGHSLCSAASIAVGSQPVEY